MHQVQSQLLPPAHLWQPAVAKSCRLSVKQSLYGMSLLTVNGLKILSVVCPVVEQCFCSGAKGSSGPSIISAWRLPWHGRWSAWHGGYKANRCLPQQGQLKCPTFFVPRVCSACSLMLRLKPLDDSVHFQSAVIESRCCGGGLRGLCVPCHQMYKEPLQCDLGADMPVKDIYNLVNKNGS